MKQEFSPYFVIYMDLSLGFVTWICHLDLSLGFVTWICHLDLSLGFVTWICHVDLSKLKLIVSCDGCHA